MFPAYGFAPAAGFAERGRFASQAQVKSCAHDVDRARAQPELSRRGDRGLACAPRASEQQPAAGSTAESRAWKSSATPAFPPATR